MQLRKSLIVFAALLAGFGLIGSGEVQAATIKNISITSPDSGSKRGIDSLFSVRVAVQDFSPIDSLEVVMYLGTNDSTVLADTTNVNLDFGSLSAVSVIFAGALSQPSVSLIHFIADTDGNKLTGQAAAPTSAVAVQQKRGRGLASAASHTGDADSVQVDAATNDTTVFIWKGRIHASSPTSSGIKAHAFAIASGTTSSVVASTETIFADGDRPGNAEDFIDVDGNVTDNSQEAIDGDDAGGEVNVTTFNNTASNDHKVLGIGDTLTTRVKLGGQLNPVLGSDSLKVILSIFGQVKTVFEKGVLESPRDDDTLKFVDVLLEGEYADLNETTNSGDTDTLAYHVVDMAGNWSSVNTSDVVPVGVTAGTQLLFDTTKPSLDAQAVAGDTILPVSTDTITDGSLNTGFPDDINPITWNLASVLDSLVIELEGSSFHMIVQNGQNFGNSPDLEDEALRASQDFTLDFHQFGNAGSSGRQDSFIVSDGSVEQVFQESANAGGGFTRSASDTLVTTGTYTVKFTPTDAAGNTGSTLSRTNVYLDVDDITLTRLFPTAAAGLDTLEEVTAQVIFQLSEPTDSVAIVYTGLSGTDKDSTRTYNLVGGQLTKTDAEQTFPVPGLVNENQYTLQITARDLAGNFTQTAADTFQYDTTFTVPVIASFDITLADANDGANTNKAGDEITVTLTAKTINDKTAVTYGGTAVLSIVGGGGVAATGTGATDNGGGRISLNSDDWVIGERTVTLTDSVAVDTLTLSISDSTDTTNNIYLGEADSVVVINPADYSQIIVSAADTVGQGDNFWVDVTTADKFGNARVADNRFVDISANKLGVSIPTSAIHIAKGAGGFWANSSGWSGAGLVLTARDIVGKNATNVAATGDDFFFGTDTVYVDGNGSNVLDAPDSLFAQDYMGASGEGDQGGFVLLTFDASDDHSTLSGYRIYRQISVTYGADSTGALAALSEPTNAMVPWGSVDAVPGADIMRVVVATLDGDSTSYGVSAERGGLTTAKQAFADGESIANPYELMAQTMAQSKEAAQHVPGVPVFAMLTPEALAFDAKGIVPRLKTVDGLEQSFIIRSDAVRSVDNIAPAPVAFMRALDTPVDAGGSITVSWAKSPDDRMLTSSVAQAVGGHTTYTTPGVEAYNIYRKVGAGAYTMVGEAAAGGTSFADQTVFNGVRYTYQVKPRDADNLTESEFEKTAMAIRNNVVDASGNPVYGLFGVDNQVGFDDFFILADQIGVTAADEGFEPAFDLSPNNKVDLDDFFTFADNFGKAIAAAGKSVPMMAGLNSEARFYLDAGTELPRVGDEMAIAVSLQDFAELKGYGLSVSYDNDALEYVGARVENSILGASQLAQCQLIAQEDGLVSIAAYGDVATEGDLGLDLVFRSLREIEDSYIEITDGEVRDGSFGLNSVATPVSVRIQTRPEVYALKDNYPNPFNPETTIKYQLPNAGDVTLEIYNMLGQVVRTLVSQHQTAGRYVVQWDAANDNGQDLSSGIYLYRVQVGGEFQDVKKMLLLK